MLLISEFYTYESGAFGFVILFILKSFLVLLMHFVCFCRIIAWDKGIGCCGEKSIKVEQDLSFSHIGATAPAHSITLARQRQGWNFKILSGPATRQHHYQYKSWRGSARSNDRKLDFWHLMVTWLTTSCEIKTSLGECKYIILVILKRILLTLKLREIQKA